MNPIGCESVGLPGVKGSAVNLIGRIGFGFEEEFGQRGLYYWGEDYVLGLRCKEETKPWVSSVAGNPPPFCIPYVTLNSFCRHHPVVVLTADTTVLTLILGGMLPELRPIHSVPFWGACYILYCALC
jgi:hypothetical protein